MNLNSNQMYSNTLSNNSHINYQSQVSENANVINILSANSSRTAQNNVTEQITSNEYITSNAGNIQIITSYVTSAGSNSSDMLHHHQYVPSIKKLDQSYFHLPLKDQHHQAMCYGSDNNQPIQLVSNSNVQQTGVLPILTPISSKYLEYSGAIVNVSNEEPFMLLNEDSEKSDCESLSESHKVASKHVKRNLPHKKRIARKLNSSQDYSNHEEQQQQHPQYALSSEPADEVTLRVVQPVNPHFECNLCFAAFAGQLDFFNHLKDHYEPPSEAKCIQRRPDDKISEAHPEQNLMIQARHQHHQHHAHEDEDINVPENLIIESLEESTEDAIKNEGMDLKMPVDVQDIDHFSNEFSEPEDMMEDLRKEVEKVVETIADNEEMSAWNYHDDEEEMNDNHASTDLPHDYSETMHHQQTSAPEEALQYITNQENDDNGQPEQLNHNESSDHTVQEPKLELEDDYNEKDIHQQDDDFSDDEDNRPLEDVRQALKKSMGQSQENNPQQAVDDMADRELNECLKKIHNYKCNLPECGKAFNSRTALGYHLKTHTTDRRYVCDQCGKKFLTNGALKVHLRLHSDDRPYHCEHPDCGKSFRQWGDLKYHQTSIHSDTKDHVCEFCAKAFARKYSLVIHRRIHTGEKNYRCDFCEKSFRASSYLLNHRRIHTGEKPYLCSVCQKKFRVQGDLKRHMKIHERSKAVVKPLLKDKRKSTDDAKAIKKDAAAKQIPVVDTKEECVDLSIKEEKDEKTLVYSNNHIDIYRNETNSNVLKDVDKSKKERKTSKRKKAK